MSRERVHATNAARQAAYRQRERNVTNGGIAFSRVFARASAWTFSIKPIAVLLRRYGVGEGWVDPFAGKFSPAEWTNDLDPARPARYHLDAAEFVAAIAHAAPFRGALFDPPYSRRQQSEHYKAAGLPVTGLETSHNYYGRVLEPLTPLIAVGGYGISCGWTTGLFTKKRGFRIVEVMLVAHGLSHHDTLVCVERKMEGR